MAVFVAGGPNGVLRHRAESDDPRDDRRAERGPAEFAIGDRLQPDLLLEGNGLGNKSVLKRLEGFVRWRFGLFGIARCQKLGGAQQAADMIGAKRRFGICIFGHKTWSSGGDGVSEWRSVGNIPLRHQIHRTAET